MAGGKRFAERRPHVFEIAARAVQQHNRRRARLALPHLDDMLTQAADIDEASARGGCSRSISRAPTRVTAAPAASSVATAVRVCMRATSARSIRAAHPTRN
jgi:hypothetical protein